MIKILSLIAIVGIFGGLLLTFFHNQTSPSKILEESLTKISSPKASPSPKPTQVPAPLVSPSQIIKAASPTPKPTEVPMSTPTPGGTLGKQLFNCSEEAKAQISAYSKQIQDEYDKCKSGANLNMKQQQQTCQSSCDKTRQDDLNSCITQSLANLKPDGTSSFDVNACTGAVNSKYGSCSASCFSLGLADLNACTSTYQEKTKYTFTLMGQLCKYNQ